jgi:hypothetical protein
MGWVTSNVKSVGNNKMHATVDKTSDWIQMRIYNQQQFSDSLKKIKAWIHLFQLGTIGGNPLPTDQKSQKGDCFRNYLRHLCNPNRQPLL